MKKEELIKKMVLEEQLADYLAGGPAPADCPGLNLDWFAIKLFGSNEKWSCYDDCSHIYLGSRARNLLLREARLMDIKQYLRDDLYKYIHQSAPLDRSFELIKSVNNIVFNWECGQSTAETALSTVKTVLSLSDPAMCFYRLGFDLDENAFDYSSLNLSLTEHGKDNRVLKDLAARYSSFGIFTRTSAWASFASYIGSIFNLESSNNQVLFLTGEDDIDKNYFLNSFLNNRLGELLHPIMFRSRKFRGQSFERKRLYVLFDFERSHFWDNAKFHELVRDTPNKTIVQCVRLDPKDYEKRWAEWRTIVCHVTPPSLTEEFVSKQEYKDQYKPLVNFCYGLNRRFDAKLGLTNASFCQNKELTGSYPAPIQSNTSTGI